MRTKILRIAAAQVRFRRTVRENVELACNLISKAARVGSDAILFPECMLTGYNLDFRQVVREEVEDGLRSIAETARKQRCNVLIGSPTFRRGKLFNSLIIFDRKGREVFRYHKIHLTPRDAQVFAPGNSVAFFHIDGVRCTALICHERRYPELIRLPVMLGAQVIFHSNAGLDTLQVSKRKRDGRDGIVVRAFENQVYYVFANSVGPQGDGLWSAGDSKIVAPDSEVLALANNRDEMLIHGVVDLEKGGRKYAREALQQPAFLRSHWKAMLAACRAQVARGAK